MTDANNNPGFLKRVWRTLRRPTLKYSLLTLLVAGFAGGILFWGAFNTAMEATNTMSFCTSCHEMRDNVYAEYKTTIHAGNRTGVQATCSDCHVPKDWTHKIIRKVQASNELLHKALGSIDTKEKFDAKRLTLARHEWDRMKANDSAECRNCHGFEAMNPEYQRPRARKQHLAAMEAGNTCIDCHKGIAHKNVRDKLDDATLEQLEKPLAQYIREIPQTYRDGLARAEARETETEKKKQAELNSAVEGAVAAALAQAQAKAKVADAAGAAKAPAAGATASPGAAAAASGKIDWSATPAKTLGFFFPGQTSFEWVQNGKDHGGARAFLRSGDRCTSCHDKEVRDMGAKMVSGQKAEEAPIPGKRGHVDVKVQTAHDGERIYFRFQFPQAPHTPVPFVDGGKMDRENEVKMSIMFSGAKVERADLAGCWVTCHHDARNMPDAPKPEALAAFPQKDVIDLANGVTKYLAESRTAIEIKESPRGGWDKLKSKDELAALPAAGSAMELMRYRSNGAPEHGLVTAERKMSGLSPIEATGGLEGGVYTVVMSRPMKASAPGETNFEPGKSYIVSFALHEDFTASRFHHVSLAYQLTLDGEGEIVAKKQ